ETLSVTHVLAQLLPMLLLTMGSPLRSVIILFLIGFCRGFFQFNPACHCKPSERRRGNPVLSKTKHNAERRCNDIALRFSGCLNDIKNSVLQRLHR
ncbi:MAG: hypothetical protein J6W29_04185, partial [Neisseriaceae bacterium]|nr:hypothetical protein [Neisseriaceae bacterium]